MDKLNRLLKDSRIEVTSARIREQIEKDFSKRLNSLSYEIEYEFNESIADNGTKDKVIDWIRQVKNYLEGSRKKLLSDKNWVSKASEWLDSFDKIKSRMRSQEIKRIGEVTQSIRTTEHLIEAALHDIDLIKEFMEKPLKIEIPLIEINSDEDSKKPTDISFKSQDQSNSAHNSQPESLATQSVTQQALSDAPPPPPPPPNWTPFKEQSKE